jgi:hypothetical protein
MIWNRQQYIAHCQYEFTGREMFCELFGPLLQLEEEWRRQGATEKEISMTAFEWDYVTRTGLPGNTGAITGITPVVLEDTPEYTISIDRMGRRMKLIKKSASIPLPLTHPVETMDDWLKIKHWYTFTENRVNREALRERKALRDKGYLTIFSIPGGFDEPRQLLGEENLCYAYYDEPEMIGDMMNTFTDTALKVLERVGDIVPIDNLIIHEDMAGKNGPLIGPGLVEEFIAPYYSKVWDAAKSYGAKLFSQDSDGDMNPLIDVFMKAGVNCFYPLERYRFLEDENLNEGSLFHRLRDKYGINVCGCADTIVEIVRATPEYAALLDVPIGEPLFFLNNYFVDDKGTPLFVGRDYIAGSRYVMHI